MFLILSVSPLHHQPHLLPHPHTKDMTVEFSRNVCFQVSTLIGCFVSTNHVNCWKSLKTSAFRSRSFGKANEWMSYYSKALVQFIELRARYMSNANLYCKHRDSERERNYRILQLTDGAEVIIANFSVSNTYTGIWIPCL